MAHNQPLDAEDAYGAAPADAPADAPVFVYGTLKRGHSNHAWLAGATWLGEQRLRGVRLYDLGPFPMAVQVAADDPAADQAVVHGELYRVSARALVRLDALEGCPRLYGRQWLPLADGRHAWVYLGRPQQVRHAPLLADGLWRGRSGLQA